MATYQERALDGASPVDLVVALYDGIIRFLYVAIAAVERGDVRARRIAVKRALAIVIHLQARLRMDIGGEPARALSDFYAAMFNMTLEASGANSREQFEEVIKCVRNVRDAWVIASKDPSVGKVLPRELRTREEKFLLPGHHPAKAQVYEAEAVVSSWRA